MLHSEQKMPPKKPYRRKPKNGRYGRKRKVRIGRPGRGLTQSIYKFRSRHTQSFVLNDPSVPAGWEVEDNGLCRQWSFRLSDIYDFGKWQGLFKKYKLDWAMVEIYPSFNTITSATLGQLIHYMVPNQVGRDMGGAMSEQDMLETQACKKSLVVVNSYKPIRLYFKLKQLSMRYGTTGVTDQTDYAEVKPRWVDTQEASTEHYGAISRIQQINNSALAAVIMRVDTTVGFSCMGVK